MDDASDDYRQQHELLDRLVRGVDRSVSVAALQRYFRDAGPAEELFTGRWFDRFGGGGYTADVANVMTAGDVLALTHLGVSDGLSELAVAIVERRAAEITALLTDIPLTAMHDVSADKYDQVFGRQSRAWQLWDLLRRCAGQDRWVVANKLLARKRPALLPVYDRVVREVLQQPSNVWACLWSWFHNDPTRLEAVMELRADAGDIEDISLLRCLDVVLWMAGRRRS